MSQQPPQQPPYGGQPPYGAPPPPPGPYAPPPKKPRPRAVWFVVGGVLLALAPIIFVGAIFTVLRPLTQEDAVFRVDETPVLVELPAGEERAVFLDDPSSGQGHCDATDSTGAVIDFRPVSGEFTYNEWTATARFDTGDGDVTFECTGNGSDRLRIAQLPSTGTFVAGLILGIIVPLVLGLAGMAILIITGVLWASRPPRTKAAPPPGGPGTPAS